MIKGNYKNILKSFKEKDYEKFKKLINNLKESIQRENLKLNEAKIYIEEYKTLKKAYIQAQKDLDVVIDYISYGKNKAKVKEIITRIRNVQGTSQLKDGQVYDKVIRNIIKGTDITAGNEAW